MSRGSLFRGLRLLDERTLLHSHLLDDRLLSLIYPNAVCAHPTLIQIAYRRVLRVDTVFEKASLFFDFFHFHTSLEPGGYGTYFKAPRSPRPARHKPLLS